MPSPTLRPERGMAGFTLVELVIVIVLVGIISAVALPRMSAVTGYDEVVYRDKVKSGLEFARRTAVSSRRIACATVSGNSVSFQIEQNPPETAGSGQCASGGLLSRHDLDLPVADGSCIAATNTLCPPTGVTLADDQIDFDALGRPLTAAGAVRTADVVWTITNTKTGGTTSLTIAAGSGYVY